MTTAEKSPSEKASPIQRRAYRTRASLLEAVEAVVAGQGAAAVTTTAIAAHAGVSVGTLYRYYADRDELLLAAYDATVERIVAGCGEALSALPEDLAAEDAARALLTVYLDAAEAFFAVSRRPVRKVPTLRGKTIINLFYEPSTRTRTPLNVHSRPRKPTR